MVAQNRIKPAIDRQNYDVGYSDGWLDGFGEASYGRWESAAFAGVVMFALGLLAGWMMR